MMFARVAEISANLLAGATDALADHLARFGEAHFAGDHFLRQHVNVEVPLRRSNWFTATARWALAAVHDVLLGIALPLNVDRLSRYELPFRSRGHSWID